MTGRRKLAMVMQARHGDGTKRWVGWAVAALLLWAAAAFALDPPHDATTPNGYCMDCHTPHNALGPALQAQPVACLSCHNALPKPPTMVSGFGLSQGWASADQAGETPNVGSSHNWSRSAVNPAAAAQLPTDPEMLRRINNPPPPYQGNLSCAVCHNPHSQANVPFDPVSPTTANAADRHFMRYPNAAANNGLCVQCHVADDVTAADTFTGAAQSHPIRKPLPSGDTTFYTVPQLVGGGAQVAIVDGAATAVGTTSLTDSTKAWGAGSLVGQWVYLGRVGQIRQITANTATQVSWAAGSPVAGLKVGDLYQVDPDGNPSNKHALLNGSAADGTTGNVVCLTCHAVHYADSDSTTLDNKPGGGDGRLLRRSLTPSGWVNSSVAGKDDACVGCHNLRPHSSTVTATGRYTFAFGCTDCHDVHGTTNVMLVKGTLTYATGLSTSGVDLRAMNTAAGSAPDSTFGPAKDTGGVGPNDLANNLAPGKGPCEACHTQTQDLAAAGAQPRFRNTGGGASGRHFQNQCLACHPHNQGFKGQESTGNQACYPCHSYGMRNADATALKQGTYHHVIESDAVAGFAPSATPTAAIDGDKRCIQCHVDHPFGANRATNLRTGIANATAVATDNAATTPFGVCLSCHTGAQTKNTTDQKSDGTTATYAISQADYVASAHDYATEPTGTIFKATSGNFTVSCVKCHSDGQPTATQSGTFKFALHSSNDRRLRNPLGITTFANAGDALEEDFCYRCHSASTDTNPGSGPAKTITANDYFGVVTTMSAGATGIFAQMQKGTTSTPPSSTTTTNTLYFKPTGQENPAEPMPNQHNQGDTFSPGGGTWIGRSMSPFPATTAYETKSQATTVNGTATWRMVTFTSPPASAAASIPAGSWTINIYDRESNTAQNAFVKYMIYQWNANDTAGGTIIAGGVFASEMGTTVAPGALQAITVAGSAVSLAAGDKIVVDLELRTTTAATTSYTAAYYFGQGAASNLVMPANMTFTYANPGTPTSGRHDVHAYAGIHRPNPTDETQTYISVNKHVECEDCHNPHAARGTKHAAGTNAIAATSPLLRVTGTEPTYPTGVAANFAAPTSYTWQDLPTGATKEYQICFKCHSSANGSLATWDATWTDVATEFSSQNRSGHPVVAGLASYPNSAAPKALISGQMAGGWTAVGTQTMYCTDCHTNDAASPAAQGPHGSAVKFILKGPWPPSTATFNTTSLNTQYTSSFCAACHTYQTSGNYHTQHTSEANMRCTSCHVQVPHGSGMSRLLCDGDSSMPARYAYQGTKANCWVSSFTKGSGPTNYSTNNCGATSTSGCTGDHPSANGTENW